MQYESVVYRFTSYCVVSVDLKCLLAERITWLLAHFLVVGKA